jgi:hypothetical protein
VAAVPFLSEEQRRTRPTAVDAAAVNECDICIGHPLPQKNTALLRTYAEVDPRAKQLILAVKIWAKKAGVADSANGMLSSYAWSLLCVFYLQQCEPPVLPVLQSSTLIGTRWRLLEQIDGCDVSFCQDATEAHTSLAPNHNDVTVAELLDGFFHFFGWRNLSKAVVSVRLGKIYGRDLGQKKTKWRMCIEDPFELSRDLGEAISCSEGQREITKALRQAAVAVRSGSADSWIPQERCGVAHVCHNCCEAGHSQRECLHDHWPVEFLCFSCGKAGHKSNECPNTGLTDDSDSGRLTRTGSGLRLLNGMRPFPPGFDPRVEMKARPIPDQFEDKVEYFDTMAQNILCEVSARVKNSNGVVEIVAEMCECIEENDRPQYILRFPPCDGGDYSWYNHLLQTESGECVIVRDEKPEHIVEFGALPADRLVTMQEMNWAPVGTKLTFKDYGYQGNLIGSYLAIGQLRCMDDADLPRLLEPILSAGEDASEGEFASDDNESERDLNVEQLAVLKGLRDNLTVIQGPPGTGKTRLISNMLSCKIPDGTSALVTSESNQAIENLCEVLARSCPDVNFVALGKPKTFLNTGRLSLFYHSLEVQTALQFCPAMRELKHDQLLELILAVGIGGEAPFNMHAPSSVRAHLERPWNLLRDTIERHEKHGLLGYQEVLDLLVKEAEAAVIDRCSTFVCTVGSVERAKKEKFADKNIRTAIVDESSLLPEFSISRLLVHSNDCWKDEGPKTWIENLVLVGDHTQLEPFTNDPSRGRPGSLMQRCAEVSGCHMLVEQYRMDPAICEVVTSVFYGRMLRTNPAVAIQRRADRRAGTSPVTVHDINDGVEQHPPNSTSLYNEAEANAILKWYKEKRACTNGNRVGRTDRSRLRDERQAEKEKSILIVTLYSAQQRLLQQLLPADTEHHSFEKHGRYKDHNLRIVTVDKSQGSEGDIVALSCVRANFNRNIGHARNPKRVNVALSRAREELHIFAHMQTVAHQRPWSQVFAAIDGTCEAARVARMDDPFEQYAALGMVYDDDYDDAEFRALGQFPALPQKTLPPQRQDDYDDAQFRALGQFPALPQKTLPPQRQAIALAPRAA